MKKMKHLGLILLLFIIFLLNCREKNTANISREDWQKTTNIFLQNCGACHTLTPPPKNGPPIVGLLGHYKSRFKNYPLFRNKVLDFIKNPTKKKVIMNVEAEKFGIMPKMDFSGESLDKITLWMWNFYKYYKKKPGKVQNGKFEGITLGKGGSLFLKNCGACHSFSPPPKNGPPARGLSKHYKHQYKNFAAFNKAILSFVLEPDKNKVLMQDALGNYGLMPKMQFKKEDLMEISRWLWKSF